MISQLVRIGFITYVTITKMHEFVMWHIANRSTSTETFVLYQRVNNFCKLCHLEKQPSIILYIHL